MPEKSTPESTRPLERRLATILCADVASYSKMMAANEEQTVNIFRAHREIFESTVNLHRGRIFNTAGDALLVEFNSPVEAVRCATEIQSALRTRNELLGPEEEMEFRIGINIGDVIIQGNDLLGDGVNVAARIQAATTPGGICISGSVHDQIQNKLSLDFKLLGEQTYKNIPKPVRTYTINEGTATVTPARKKGWQVSVMVIAAILAIAGSGYWGYRQYDANRTEQLQFEARMAAQVAEQKQAADQAQRALDQAQQALDQAQQAAEEAKREKPLLVQKQAKGAIASSEKPKPATPKLKPTSRPVTNSTDTKKTHRSEQLSSEEYQKDVSDLKMAYMKQLDDLMSEYRSGKIDKSEVESRQKAINIRYLSRKQFLQNALSGKNDH